MQTLTACAQGPRCNAPIRHATAGSACFALVLTWLAALLPGDAPAAPGATGPALDPAITVHLCEADRGLLQMVDIAAQCAPGRRSLFLRKAGAATIAQSGEKCASPRASDTSDADKRRIAQLEQRLQKLEQAATRGELGARVVAPFKVVDRAGRPIFSVEGGQYFVDVKVFNAEGKVAAGISGKPWGGTVWGQSASGTLVAGLGEVAPLGTGHIGVSIEEKDMPRVWLARSQSTGTYQLQFYSSADKQVAGIGEATGGSGGVFVADSAGTRKALMGVTAQRKGMVWIANGRSEGAVASLTEGASGGGLLDIWSSSGGQPMVEAGVAAGGFGVVRAGPESFKPGYGVLGLPGSYITGKPK
jgi:hypothetical protein